MHESNLSISVFGLGYVGTVSAACLANQGHRVIGIDVNATKVDLINQGKSPVVEAGLGTIISQSVDSGMLSASTDLAACIAQTEISLLCVGTPSRENGSLDLQYIERVALDLGRALKEKCGQFHVVAVRSTMLPGSLEERVLPILEEASGGRAGVDFGLCVNPEFLREGSAVSDYQNPPFTLIGSMDDQSGELLASVYANISAPTIQTDVRTAEAVKYACNCFHAVKVAFANEMGRFCKANGVDSHRVMDIFTQDTQLNISAKYLKPAFAFGGSCLPKDLRALLHRAKTKDVDLPLLNSLLPSNDLQIEQCLRTIYRTEKRRIGILGLSFKAGTDDLRESPLVRLTETLIGKGYDIRIYDENVSLAALVGANREYIQKVIPHISSLLVSDGDQLISHAEVLVLGVDDAATRQVLQRATDEQSIIDLVRIDSLNKPQTNHYEGICW